MAYAFNTLVDMIQSSIARFPRNPCLGTKVAGRYEWITYEVLGSLIDRMRGGLAGLGVSSGDRVGIIANNRVEWVVTCYATQQLGGAIAPMYESQSVRDWEHILNDCQPTVLVISTKEILERVRPIVDAISSIQAVVLLEGGAEGVVTYPELLARGAAEPAPVAEVEPGSMCTLIYTSGTTGRPKGVMLSHTNIVSNVNAIHEVFPVEQSDVSLSFLPWAHSFGLTVELHVMLSYGASIGIAERVDTIVDNLSEVRPTVLFSVPRIWNKIYDGLNKKVAKEPRMKQWLFRAAMANAARVRPLQLEGKPTGVRGLLDRVFDRVVFSQIREKLGGRLKYAISGGAALSPEVARFIDNLNILVFEGYGLSETSPIATANVPGARRIGSIGKPIPGVTIKLDRSVESDDPEVGEIINYGPNTMMGYYKMPEATREVMTEDGGLRTGDLGRFDADGYIHVTGRVKELYKLENGKYVAPVPLEETLQLSPYISQVMLHGMNRPANIALVVLDAEAVMAWCRAEGVAVDGIGALPGCPEVRDLIRREIDARSKDWKGYERPREIELMVEEWTVENGLLTPSLKVKRRNVVNKYHDRIEAAYQRLATGPADKTR